ncbi:MAG: porin [Salinarimonas sp.]|nr:porin [Salinarimonas sp.]
MKLVKSLLLGSAAGIVAVGSAVAADLPVRKAAPVDYVQVCSQFGTGYFFIPGTDTCLRIGGHVRWTGTFSENKWTTGVTAASGFALDPAGGQPTAGGATLGRGSNAFTMGTNREIGITALTATEFGTLESMIRLTNESADRAYVDFAGFRAGLFPTVFSAGGSAAFTGGTGLRGATAVNQLTYTADLGAASVTLGISNPNADATGIANARTPRLPFGATATGVYGAGATPGPAVPVAGRMPDIVGNVKASFGDVDLHLGGALTQLRTTAQNNTGFIGSTYGWALQGRADVGLGTISPSTSLTLVGTYTDGALWYLNAPDGRGLGRYQLSYADAYVVNGGLSTTTGWSIYGALNHGWAPNVSQTVYGVYGEINVPAAARRTFNAGQTPFNLVTDPNNSSFWQLGSKIEWNPVANLMVGLDVNYTAVQAQNRVLVAGTEGANNAIYQRNSDAWAAQLRIQRNF